MRARILTTMLFFLLAPAALAGEEDYRVIAHPDVSVSSVERSFLRDAFLKKRTRWPGDAVIRPVDHDKDSAARRNFSKDVLGRSVSAVKSYWQQVIFSGRDVPPPELDNDAQVLRYVQDNAGAIGYVSPKADVSGVKILPIR